MKTKRTRWWLKSAALLCATVFGLTAFGSFYEWTATEKAYWDGDGSWTLNGEGDVTDRRAGNNGSEIAFASQIEDTDTYLLGFYNGSYNFSADSDEAGLTRVNGELDVGEWWAPDLSSTLSVSNGTYTFGTVKVGPVATGTLNLNGGLFTASTVNIATAGSTVNLNGGTLSATAVSGTGTLAVGANGGTFANDAAATISVALTGSGTLTKTGSGTLAITGDISAFKGKIAVAEGAGVTVGDITIAAGEEVQFGVYTWTGAGTAVEPEEEGGETTYINKDLWSNLNNWLVNGTVPTALPGDDSVVLFPAGDDVTVVVNGARTGNMTINRNVTLAAENVSGSVYLYLDRVGGTGTLTLKGASNTRWLRVGNAGDYAIDCDLEIKGHVYLANSSAKTLVVNGAFKGDGTVTCNNNNDAGIAFYGDTSAFAGYYEGGFRNNGNRDNTKFREDARGSALASWHFCGYGDTLATPFEVNGVTYQFGKLDTFSGTTPRLTMAGRTSTTIEVGALANTTSTVGGTLSDNSNVLRKVGATSTLNFTATEEKGTVEAKEGTTVILGTVAPAAVKFAGTGATIKIARSTTTTTEVDSGEEDDESTTDVDESKTTTTTTTDNIASSFVPGFTDALVGCQYEVAQETVDNVTYDVYTVLTDVATDSAGTKYDSVALALAAIAADETGTLTKVVTLAKSTTEAVTLPLYYSLALNGKTVGSVAGAAGVGVAYDEETQTWTTDDNSEATWTGKAGDGLWETAGNWSTEFVPNEGTKVVFTGNATVFLADNNTYDCGSIYISRDDATVTFAPVDYNESNWPRVKVYGNIGAHGNCVLKLYRCGIDNGTDGRITVRPTVTFENTTGDSWFTGNFELQAGLNGTGEFRIDGGTIHFATGSGITVNAGSVVDFRNYYPTFEGRSGSLQSTGVNGDGRIIVHSLPTSSTLTYFQNAFKNAERWTGTCELAGFAINNIDAANYGNANSTVCFNGVSGYLRAGEGVEVGNVKTIEIGANGLTLNNQYTAGAVKNYLIKADLTGTGAIKFGTKHQLSGKSKYVFTGDVSGFTGAINYGDLDSYRACVYFADSSITTSDFGSLTAPTDWGQIIVEEGKTVNVAATWYGAGGWLINGTVNVAAGGSLTCDSNGAKVGGTGTINYAALPTSAPTWNTTAWKGAVVLPETVIKAKTGLQLPALSSANGTLVIKGITRENDQRSLYLGSGATCTIAGTTQLDGDLHITDGNSNATYTWNKITGTGDILFTTAGGSASGVTHAITTLDGYTGTLDVGGNATLTLGTVAVDAVEIGTPLVKLSSTCNMSVAAVAAVAVEAGGTALANASVVKESDGLYIAAASVDVTTTTTDPDTQEETTVTTTTKFSTYEAAAAFADANSVTNITVLYGDGAVNGWDYDSETGTLTKNAAAIARVGTMQYNTLAAAFEAATADDTVVLFGASAEAVTVAEGQTLVVEGVYTGTLSGSGTVDAKVVTTPAGFSSWTGTFVLDWDASAANDNTAWELNKYGVSGSTVVIAQPIAKGYFKAPVTGSNLHSIAPAVYLKANVSITNGYANNNNQDQTTTFAELGADEGVTFSFRYLAGAAAKDTTVYAITKLSNFAGTLVLNAYNQVTIGSVDVEVPAFGTKVVNATIADTASLTGKIAEGYPLVAKADGLYYDPVAQVGEAYYNTLAEAIAAANGAVVTLVQSTEEGYTFTGAGTVKIQFNGQTCGTIAAPEGAYVFSVAWQEETTTATYTCRVAAASASIGGVVTYYSTVQEAYLAVNANGSVGDSFTVLDGTDYGTLEGFSYDAETATYTKIATIAQFTFGVHTYSFTTLASACATAEEYDPIPTVTLLVALGEQTVPEGWEYNTPEASETEFGTLTKVVAPQPITVDTDGCDFTVDATTAAAIAAATGVDTTNANFGKAAIAYVVGGDLEDGEVVIPTPTIKVSGTTVTVVYDSETANADAYTVTCTLYSFSLADANDSSKWTTVATGEIGDELKDTGASAANKFYKVGVTITNK
ncbi:MAG: hypothetical protein IJ173_11855 [Kiritimatiellae bacterium]|nr:hypothetical protein [Kiritimatiellia bacterium]